MDTTTAFQMLDLAEAIDNDWLNITADSVNSKDHYVITNREGKFLVECYSDGEVLTITGGQIATGEWSFTVPGAEAVLDALGDWNERNGLTN